MISERRLGHFIVAGLTNYTFFVPTVGIFNWLINGWTWDIFTGYALVSVPFAFGSGYIYARYHGLVMSKLFPPRLIAADLSDAELERLLYAPTIVLTAPAKQRIWDRVFKR